MSHTHTAVTDIMRHIGSKIQFRRKQRKMTQNMLGKPLGLSSGNIGLYETGKLRIRAETLYRIVVILDTPVEWFFPYDRPQVTDGIKQDVRVLMRAFLQIKDAQRRDRVIAIAEECAFAGF